MVVWPLAVAVQVHQTLAPPKFPAIIGSPDRKSLFAPTLLPVAVTIGPVRAMPLPKLSLIGAANALRPENRPINMSPRRQKCFIAGEGEEQGDPASAKVLLIGKGCGNGAGCLRPQ